MAYEFDPTLDFDAQEQQMLQAAARIKALRDMKLPGQELRQPEGFTSAVTGKPFIAKMTKQPLLGQLAPLMRDYAADYQEQKLGEDRIKLSRAQQENATRWLSGEPQDTFEPLPVGTPVGSFGSGDSNKDPQAILTAINDLKDPVERADALAAYRNQQSGNRMRVPPTRQAMMDWTAAGLRGGPLTRTLATKLAEYKLTKEPELAENRALRLHEKELAIWEAQRKQADELEYRRWQQKQHNDMLQSIAEGNQAARRDAAAATKAASGHNWTYLGPDPADPTKGLYGDPHEPTKPPVQGPLDRKKPEGELKNLPVNLITKYASNEAAIAKFDAVAADTSQDDATGYVKGKILQHGGDAGSNFLALWGGQGEVARRAAIQRIAAIEVHEMAGANTTVYEYPRLKPYIPLMTDDADTVRTKMADMKRVLKEENAQIDLIAQTQGYKPPKLQSSEAPPVVTPPTGAPPAQEPPTPNPAGVGPDGRTSLQVNQAAFDQAKAEYVRHPTKTNKEKMDLAWADLQRVKPAPKDIKGALNEANAVLPPPNAMSNEDRLRKYGIGVKK